MGIYVRANIFYGVCFNRMEVIPWEKDSDDETADLEQWLASFYRFIDPPLLPECTTGEEWERLVKPRMEEYLKFRNNFLNWLNLKLGRHYHYNNPEYYLCIRSSEREGWCGSPVELKDMKSHQSWDQRLLSFCREARLSCKIKIGWWLVSYQEQ